MSGIPCPKEVFISTELSSGLGQRLPCYSIRGNVIIVRDQGKENIATKGDYAGLKSNPEHRSSVKFGDTNQATEKNLTLEELRTRRPPGFKEFEAALGSQNLDEEVALQLWEDIFKPLRSGLHLMETGYGYCLPFN